MNPQFLLALVLFVASTSLAQARIFTLTVETVGFMFRTNNIEVAANEVVEILSYNLNSSNVTFVKEDKEYPMNNLGQRTLIAGPVTIQLKGNGNVNSTYRSYLTVQITPESFPPDKTLIIPDGSFGATVTLECSTNLVTWTMATNGFYSGTSSAKFFRIRAERTP